MLGLRNGEKLASKKNRFKTKDVEITEDSCFSIIFKSHSKPIDLVAEDADSANKWVNISFFLMHKVSKTKLIFCDKYDTNQIYIFNLGTSFKLFPAGTEVR